MPRSNGWTGSTTAGSSRPAGISHLLKPRNVTTPCWTTLPWPHNLRQMASGNPGAVQCVGHIAPGCPPTVPEDAVQNSAVVNPRSEEHTSELQSLMRTSYAVFCLKKKKVIYCKSNDDPTTQRSK